jgi:hypothetical protein
MPAEVSSSRIGAIIISGYIHFLPMGLEDILQAKRPFSEAQSMR